MHGCTRNSKKSLLVSELHLIQLIMLIHRRSTELSPDEPRPKLTSLAQEFKGEWAAMSEEDRIAATNDAMGEVEEGRQRRKYEARNSAIGSFHDSRATVDKVIHEVRKIPPDYFYSIELTAYAA